MQEARAASHSHVEPTDMDGRVAQCLPGSLPPEETHQARGSTENHSVGVELLADESSVPPQQVYCPRLATWIDVVKHAAGFRLGQAASAGHRSQEAVKITIASRYFHVSGDG
jgi:hypothetical protein